LSLSYFYVVLSLSLSLPHAYSQCVEVVASTFPEAGQEKRPLTSGNWRAIWTQGEGSISELLVIILHGRLQGCIGIHQTITSSILNTDSWLAAIRGPPNSPYTCSNIPRNTPSKGDWKFLKETFNFNAYGHNRCCHLCEASKTLPETYFTDIGEHAGCPQRKYIHCHPCQRTNFRPQRVLSLVPGWAPTKKQTIEVSSLARVVVDILCEKAGEHVGFPRHNILHKRSGGLQGKKKWSSVCRPLKRGRSIDSMGLPPQSNSWDCSPKVLCMG
jgi:hypothetical protein